MLKLTITYYLDKNGAAIFPDWYSRVEQVISEQAGFCSLIRRESPPETPTIELCFLNQDKLDKWAAQKSHEELFDEIQVFFMRELTVEENHTEENS